MPDSTRCLYNHYVSQHLGMMKPVQLSDRMIKYYELNYSRFLSQDKKSNILEIGCGMGYFLMFLRQKGYSNSIGIDVGDEQIEVCRNEGLDAQKIEAYEFLSNCGSDFNAVIMNDVIEHLHKSEVLALLPLIYAKLERGGTFIARTPNLANPIVGPCGRYSDFTHEIGFTDRSLAQVMRYAGFQEVAVFPERLGTTPLTRFVWEAFYNLSNALLTVCFHAFARTTSVIASKNIIGVARKQSGSEK
jgi:SAM-dependent methyltransferase